VEFYFELYANWLEFRFRDEGLHIELVQVVRILEHLKKEGLLKAQGKRLYQFTETGVLGLLKKLVRSDAGLRLDEVIFIRYLLLTYGRVLESLILPEDRFVTSSLRREVRDLLNPEIVKKREQERLERLVRDLSTRIEESREIASYAQSRLKSGAPTDTVVSEVDRRFGYQLSYRKPFGELYAELPLELRKHELERGIELRNERLFDVLLKQCLGELELLRSL